MKTEITLSGASGQGLKALIIDHVYAGIADGLRKHGVAVDIDPLPGTERLAEIIGEYDVLIMRVIPKIHSDILDRAHKLKVIAVCSIGMEHIDLAHAREKGITVLNAPGASSNSVAELAISKILDLNRHVLAAHNEVVHDGVWEKNHFVGHELKGQTIGIMGFGRIGSRVGELAKAFGMRVLAYDPYLTEEECAARGGKKMELNDMLAMSDCVTINMPLTEESRNIISYDQIAAMKQGAILVNMGRGGHLDEKAVAEGLRNGKLRGVGLDVISEEQGELSGEDKLSSPIFEAGGEFIVSPHLGAVTVEAQTGIGEYILSRLLKELKLA